MPILSIISNPVTNGIKAAYRPVVIRVSATRTDGNARPPVVYCDIYFNNLFYKTISKTQYTVLNAGSSEWEFDIQDAAQEYLRKYLGGNGASAILEVTAILAKTLCKFRSSGFDSNGFILAEDIEPVQGTGSTAPVAGTGTSANEFYVVNAALQHEDNQELTQHLNSLKRRTWGNPLVNTDWPLTHRPDHYKICVADSDFFPILHNTQYLSSVGNNISCLILNFRYKGQTSFSQLVNCGPVSCPLISGVEFVVVDNGDDTQTVTITFNALASPAATLDIQYRPANTTGAWISNSGSIISPREVTMAIGLYDFRFVTSGDCVASTSAEYEDIGVVECIGVDINEIPFPDAEEGVPYSHSMPLIGTAPFFLSAGATKPAWMTIAISGSNINFTGTPGAGDVANDVLISFEVVNCTASSDTYADTIDVIPAVNYTLSSSYNLSIDSVTGTGVPALPPTGLNTNLTGHHTAMSGSYSVTLSGTVVTITKITAEVNGVVVDCKPVTAAGAYSLAITAAEADDVRISINGGPC